MLWRFLRSLRVALDRGPGWDRCYHSGCSIRPRGIWRYPVRPQSAPRRHVGEGRGVDHTGIYIVVTMQARTRLQTQSKDTRVRRCMHAQDPDRDPCTCHKVCRSAIVTPPRRQTRPRGGSLLSCCGAAHSESTRYTVCMQNQILAVAWPPHRFGWLCRWCGTCRMCGAGVLLGKRGGVLLGKRGLGLRRVVRCGGGSARSGFTCRALGLRQCCGSGSACC